MGYRIRVPEDYAEGRKNYSVEGETLVSSDPYLLETFSCQKLLRTRAGTSFNRQLLVYFFPERTAAELAREAGEQGGAEQIPKATLFTSFKQYASARIKGFYFSSEKQVRVAGYDAVVYEMQFEKLTGIPRRYLACGLQIQGGEFALMFSCTDEHFVENRSDFQRCFSSFKLLDSDGLNAPRQRTAPPAPESKDVPPELTPELLGQLRESAFLDAIEKLPAGWRSSESEHFLILSHSQGGYGRRLEQHAESLWTWLSEQFSPIGDDSVQDLIIRIYHPEDQPADSEPPELRPGHVRTISLTAQEPREGWPEFRTLSRELLTHWLQQRNGALYRRLPTWVRSGLYELVPDAEFKGSRASFGMDPSEVRGMQALLEAQSEYRKQRKGEAPLRPLRELLGARSEELLREGRNLNARRQSAAFLRYLLIGPGAKQPRTEVVLQHYLGHLSELVEELERTLEAERKEQEALEELKQSMSEEALLKLEDEEYRKKRERSGKLLAEDFSQKLFDRTFGDWTEADWNEVEKGWLAYLKHSLN